MPQLLTIFLDILLPVFALVLVGYLVGPRLQLEARTLSKLAYYVLVPAFIFGIFSRATIELNLALRMAGFIIVITMGGILVSVAVARMLGAGPQLTAAYVLIAAFGNVGNFGLPVIQFRLGDEALLAASVYFLVASTFGFVVGVTAATWNRKGGHLRAVGAAFATPGVIAVLPAFLVNWLELPVPVFADRAIDLMAGALIPIMLLTLGVQLAGMGRPCIDRHVLAASMVRLLIGPLLAILLAGVFALGGIERGAGIIQTAMPAAVLTSLIALEHELMPDFVTTVVLFSTLASAVTLTAVLAFV
jgi:malate permease and related proteins